MQKSCMSVFKYLILTAAGLKYNIEEALLPPSPKGTRAQSREQTRGSRSAASSGESGSDGERRKKGEIEETRLFSMTILLPCPLSTWGGGSIKAQFALGEKKVHNYIWQLCFPSLGADFVLWLNRLHGWRETLLLLRTWRGEMQPNDGAKRLEFCTLNCIVGTKCPTEMGLKTKNSSSLAAFALISLSSVVSCENKTSSKV